MKFKYSVAAIIAFLWTGSAFAIEEFTLASAAKVWSLTSEATGDLVKPAEYIENSGAAPASRGLRIAALTPKSAISLSARSGVVPGEGLNVRLRPSSGVSPSRVEKVTAGAAAVGHDGYALMLACLGGVVFLAGRRINRSSR